MRQPMKLNIIVCVKSVVMNAPEGQVVRTPEFCELNPYDRPALEIALNLRDVHGGTVTAISMGPESSELALIETMALGVDRSILLCDAALAGSDTLATAKALGTAIKKLAPFDLVLFGARTSDSDTGQVGAQTATVLNLPLVTWAYSVAASGNEFIVERRADGFREKCAVSFPAMLAVHPGSIQPRDVGLHGIESAFAEGNVECWNLDDLGLPPGQVGEAGSPTRVISLKRVKKVRKCKFLDGSAEEQAQDLARIIVDTGLVG
jgi:electron transfer flavoprotein beta subunit